MPRTKGATGQYTMSVRRKEANGGIMPLDEKAMEYNRRSISHALEVQALSATVNKKDLDSLKEAFVSYMQLCQKNGMKPGNIGACAALGITTMTLDLWAKNDKKPEFQQFATAVKTVIATIREGMIADGALNPVIGIFWQRNFDRLRNDTEQIQSVRESGTDDDLESVSDIKKRYGHLLEE